MGYQYLLIARHGRIADLEPVQEVARRLADTLKELSDSHWPVCVTAVEHADTGECRATADVYATALQRSSRAGINLGPEEFPPYAPEKARDQVERHQKLINERLGNREAAIFIVGHEPAIDWLLCEWVDRPVALASAEIVCLARAAGSLGKWHLWWVLTPSKAAEIEPLRQKIGSKMTVLSVLAGFTLAVTVAVLVDLPADTGPRLLGGGAAACFFLAAATYVCALLAYDELMMPPRFWRTEGPSEMAPDPLSRRVVARPPSSAGIVLYQHMVSLWSGVIAALAVSGLGIVLLALSDVWVNGALAFVAVAAASLTVGGLIALWWFKGKPRVGTED